jgi:apolipoprotein N-acyltransferase
MEWSRRAFLLGWLAGTVSFLISLFWITTVTVAGWVALSLVVGIYPALWALFSGIVLRPLGESGHLSQAWLGSLRNLLVSILAAAGWVGFEWLRGTLFTGFGWNQLGVSLRDNIPLIQIAGITGTAGLSFLCVLSGSITAITVARLRKEIVIGKPKPHLDFFAVVFLIILLFSHGFRQLTAPAEETTTLRVAGVQGNIPVDDYWDSKSDGKIMGEYIRLSRLALAAHPDLLVWPEASTPHPLLLDEITFNQVKDLASGTHADFLIGSVHYEQNPRGDYNSAILLTGHADSAQIYNKVHLVPFGEFVPFRKSFPLLAWIERKEVPYDFDPGNGPALLELSVKPLKLGPLICFEDTLGDLTRRSAALGAQILTVLTNDGWFGHSVATRQHLANAQLRTVENGLPMLRVADTGISSVIDRFGRVKQTLHAPDGNTFIQGILQAEIPVPLHPKSTFYARHGNFFALGCLGLTLLCAIIFFVLRYRREV